MENETRLLSSKRDNTCLEDTLIYLGVNKTFNVCFLKLKYWTIIEVELMNWRCEHHSSNRNLSSCEFQPEKKFQGFNGIGTHRLYVNAVVLYQLSNKDPHVGNRPIYGVHFYLSRSCHKSVEKMLLPFLIANAVTKRKKYTMLHMQKKIRAP